MAQPSPQNLQNHARYVPLYHFVLFPIVLALLGWSGKRMASHYSADALFGFLLVVAVTLTIEVGHQHDSVGAGVRDFQRLSSRTGALKRGRRQ